MFTRLDKRLLAGAAAIPDDLERKDGELDTTFAEIKKSIEGLMTAHDEFKKVNDQRLAEIEKKGKADPLTEQKLTAIEQKLAGFEGLSAKLTAAEQAQKKAKEQLDEVETKLGRILAGGGLSAADPAIRSKAWSTWARAVHDAIALGVPNLKPEQQKALEEVAAEAKALSLTNDTTGGYLAPAEFVAEIIKGVTEISQLRGLARVRSTSSKSVLLPKRTGQFAAQWVAEQGTRTETTGLAWGREEIHAHEMYALVDISHQNLEDSAFNLENEIRMEADEQFAVAEGAAFVSGNGVGKPEGFMFHTGVGETNSGAATAVTADGLLTLKHALKTLYTRNAAWVLNRTTLGSIRKLKDGNGQYIWQPGLAQGKPNTIDGDPYAELPDMPSEGAGTYPVAYGDFGRGYVIVDRIAMSMLRDPFTQATAGNIRFLFYRRVGGQVVLAEAIRKLKCST